MISSDGENFGGHYVDCYYAWMTATAVTTDGRLLTWGSDKNGKLGLGDQGGRKVGQQEKTPVEVEGLKGVDVVSVSCG